MWNICVFHEYENILLITSELKQSTLILLTVATKNDGLPYQTALHTNKKASTTIKAFPTNGIAA